MRTAKRCLTAAAGLCLLGSCSDAFGLDDSPPRDTPIVYMRSDGNWDVWAIESDGTDRRRLTTYDQDDRNPVWMPGRTRIAFQSERQGGWLYSMDVRGADVQLLYRNQSCGCYDYINNFSVSPDGRRAVVSGLRLVTFGDSVMSQAIGFGGHPSWTPDGRIVYAGGTGIEVIRPDGTGRETLVRRVGARDPAISPDGKWLAYAQDTERATLIMVARADGRNPRQITEAVPGVYSMDRGPSWSSNSQFLAFERGTPCSASEAQVHIAVIRRDGKHFRNLTGGTGCGVNIRPEW